MVQADTMWPALAGDPRLDPASQAGPLGGQTNPQPIATMQVSAGVAAVRKAPQADAEMLTQARGGAVVELYHEDRGFGWVRLAEDGYVGWTDMEALSAPVVPVTHRVTALRTYVFSEPSIKSAPCFLLSFGAEVAEEGREGRFVRAARAGWVVDNHLEALGAGRGSVVDWPGIAERFVGAPYLWGGKESLGLDCSGLVQVALQAAGIAAPRDSDMQEKTLGVAVSLDAGWQEDLRRGDLVFWPGHVGIMLDATRFLHANAHHMATAIEPFAETCARLVESVGPVRSVRRL